MRNPKLMIRIKDHGVLMGMLTYPAHPKLIELLCWFVVRYSETVFTCGYEKRDYPSVHSCLPFRGMDVRSRIYDDPQAVVDDVNAHWQYDTDRPWYPCAVYHNVGRGAHIHLQVHDQTIYSPTRKG